MISDGENVSAQVELVNKIVNVLSGETGDEVSDNFEIGWGCYILGNKKCLMINFDRPGEYYEVTHDHEKDVVYCDVYRKMLHGAFDA